MFRLAVEVIRLLIEAIDEIGRVTTCRGEEGKTGPLALAETEQIGVEWPGRSHIGESSNRYDLRFRQVRSVSCGADRA